MERGRGRGAVRPPARGPRGASARRSLHVQRKTLRDAAGRTPPLDSFENEKLRVPRYHTVTLMSSVYSATGFLPLFRIPYGLL